MSALKWITAEAKKIRKQYPKRFKTWREYVAQASAIYASKHKGKSPIGKKKKVSGVSKKKPTEKAILKKIHTVKKNVDALDEAQHQHMSIGAIKSAAMKHYKVKYGSLATKKMMEKTKRGKAKIMKELRDIEKRIKRIGSI